MAKEKQVEVEYIADGRYSVYDKEANDYVRFDNENRTHKVSVELATHLLKQGHYKTKAPFFKTKGKVPVTGDKDPDIQESSETEDEETQENDS